jgi:hypothetical protein
MLQIDEKVVRFFTVACADVATELSQAWSHRVLIHPQRSD